jgi:hypothetical protein
MIHERGNVLMPETINNYEKIIYILLDNGDVTIRYVQRALARKRHSFFITTFPHSSGVTKDPVSPP